MQSNLSTEQKYLVGLFDGFAIPVSNGIDSIPNLIKMWNDFKKYPYGAVVRSKVVNGQVIIVEAGESIKNIVGYTADELKGKPLQFFAAREMKPEQVMQVANTVEQLGFCPKMNTNKHKDGHEVKTQGIIFKEKPGEYIELVWDAEKMINYEMG